MVSALEFAFPLRHQSHPRTVIYLAGCPRYRRASPGDIWDHHHHQADPEKCKNAQIPTGSTTPPQQNSSQSQIQFAVRAVSPWAAPLILPFPHTSPIPTSHCHIRSSCTPHRAGQVPAKEIPLAANSANHHSDPDVARRATLVGLQPLLGLLPQRWTRPSPSDRDPSPGIRRRPPQRSLTQWHRHSAGALSPFIF